MKGFRPDLSLGAASSTQIYVFVHLNKPRCGVDLGLLVLGLMQ